LFLYNLKSILKRLLQVKPSKNIIKDEQIKDYERNFGYGTLYNGGSSKQRSIYRTSSASSSTIGTTKSGSRSLLSTANNSAMSTKLNSAKSSVNNSRASSASKSRSTSIRHHQQNHFQQSFPGLNNLNTLDLLRLKVEIAPKKRPEWNDRF
jgi:hypothetical protein